MYTPYKHQDEAEKKAIENGGNIALFHDPGCGKTYTTLKIYKHFKQEDPGLKMLVCCPLSLIRAAWGEDTEKFTDFKYLPYSETNIHAPRGRYGSLLDIDIMGINFESLIVENRLAEIHRIMSAGSWMLAVDESSRMKNPKSKTTKALLGLARYAKHRIVASGTPAPNSEMEFWAQAKFIDSSSFPDSFYQFRNTYFHLGRGNQVMALPQGRIMSRGMMQEIFQKGWKYMITPENREKLMACMPFAHWVRKEDALDLPEKIDEFRMVRMNPNERRTYNEMKTHLVAEIKTRKDVAVITAEVALAKIMKLRQATSGFLYDENHVAHRPGKSCKMRELEDLLEELGPQQVIIWVQFHEEVEAILELLKGKTTTTLYAGTTDRDASIKDFQEGRVQYLIAHPRSAAHGLTFVNCSTSVFFSLDYSFEAHAQARDRIHRIGQTKKCLYVYLIAEKSVDEMIMDVLTRKKSLQDVYYELVQGEE